MTEIDQLRAKLGQREAGLHLLKLRKDRLAEQAASAAARAAWRLQKKLGAILLERMAEPEIRTLLEAMVKQLPEKEAGLLDAALRARP